MISRLDSVIVFFTIFEILTFLGRPFGESFGANAHEHGGRKKSKNRSRKRPCGENEEKGPGTCFPLKEENLRLPSSSEDCKFCIGSNTLCLPEARWRIYSIRAIH